MSRLGVSKHGVLRHRVLHSRHLARLTGLISLDPRVRATYEAIELTACAVGVAEDFSFQSESS